VVCYCLILIAAVIVLIGDNEIPIASSKEFRVGLLRVAHAFAKVNLNFVHPIGKWLCAGRRRIQNIVQLVCSRHESIGENLA